MKAYFALLCCVAGWSVPVSQAADPPGIAIAFGGLHPRISPAGDAAVVSWQGTICVLSEGVLTRLSRGEGWDIEPAWSPDGARIAYLRSPSFSGGAVQLIEAVGGNEIPLPKAIRGEGKLHFSPDGKRLLGQFAEGNTPAGLAWFDLQTGNLTSLPIGPGDPAELRRKRIQFTLTADGKSIVYALSQDQPDQQGGNNGPMADVWRSSAADGSGAEKLFQWPARIYDLAADPRGAGVYAVTDLGTAHNNIWFLPFDDPLRNARKLTHGQGDDDRPSLSADGRLMLCTDNSQGATTLILRNLAIAPEAQEALAFATVDHGEPGATLSVRCVDSTRPGETVTARIVLQRVGGKFHAPPGALYRFTLGEGHFYAAETGPLDLPAGDYRIVVRRGAEYRPSERTITLAPGAAEAVEISLERWTDQAAKGWYSGENHVHANYGYGEWYNDPVSILAQCEGENLNVCNAVVANSDGDAIFDREFFLGQLDPRSTDDTLVFWGQEFRSTIWGHMTLSNLSRLVEPIMTGFPRTTNPWDVPTNADIALQTADQGGLIGYTHPAANLLDLYDQPYSAKGLPVDAALCRVALMDVGGNTYEGSVQFWYRLMNCGLRVRASSGTDVFLNRVRSFPPGWARTYVHLPDGLNYADWTRGQREGRSFITNGPMLEFRVDDQGPGGEIRMDAPGTVRVKARAAAQFPMDRVELVRNGEVIQTLELSADTLSAEFEGDIEIPATGWLALRAHGPSNPHVVREPYAHSNPVILTVEGRPNPLAATDAAFFLKWIDRLQADVEARDRIPNDRLRQHVRRQLDEARAFYRALAP